MPIDTPYIIFFIMCLNPILLKGFHEHFVACGKCIECKMSRSNEWSFRIMDEASLYDKNCFVTLTYNEDNLPDGASLKRSDLQAFIKRLRRRLDSASIRYFYCGEYGSKKNRPHYHIIFFGYVPDDLYFFKYSRKKEPMYRSPFLEDVWSVPVYDDNGNQLFAKNGKPLNTPIGFVSVELLENITQARYISLYMQVKPKDGRLAPFVGMSQGIGKGSINFDKLKIDGRIYHNGKYIRAPRYYRKKAKEVGIDLSCSPIIVDTDKQKKAYLKKVYYRQINFFRRFPSLGKPIFEFAKFFIYALSLFVDPFRRKRDEKKLNFFKKFDK